jgi:peptidoglycan/LPS O-acetylase OafA/YrhL
MRASNFSDNKDYLSGVEWLRFLAAFGVVWFHTENAPWKDVGYAGLPIFILVFCALIVIHYNEMSFWVFLKKRSFRLLLPWLFWSGVFIIAKLGRNHIGGKQSLDFLSSSSLLVGGNIHLWFLPFAFLLSLILYWLCKYAFRDNQSEALITGFSTIMIIASFYATAYISSRVSLCAPFAQWLFAFPCLPLGFYLGYLFPKVPPQKRNIYYAVMFIIVLLCCVNLFWMWDETLLVPYGIGLLLTVLALTLKFPYSKPARQLGALTYGIYLIHPLTAFFVNRTPLLQAPLLSILVTFIVSAFIVHGLRLTRLRVVL